MDNLSTHDTPQVQAWLERNPNVTVTDLGGQVNNGAEARNRIGETFGLALEMRLRDLGKAVPPKVDRLVARVAEREGSELGRAVLADGLEHAVAGGPGRGEHQHALVRQVGQGLSHVVLVAGHSDTLPEIVTEIFLAKTSERQGRLIDHDEAGSMEMKKREGYF